MSYVSLIWAGLFRRRTRTLLTLFSIVVAFLLFGLLRSIADAFSVGVDVAGVDRLIVQPKYSIIDGLPIRHLNQIRAVPGVAMVDALQTGSAASIRNARISFRSIRSFRRSGLSPTPSCRSTRPSCERSRTRAPAPWYQQKWPPNTAGRSAIRIPIEADIWPKKDGTAFVGIRSRGHISSAVGGHWSERVPVELRLLRRGAPVRAGQVGSFVVRVADPSKARGSRALHRQAVRKLAERNAYRDRSRSSRVSSPTRSATSG